MNANRECYLTVCTLPFEVKIRFGKSGTPDKPKAIFRKLGMTNCLSILPIIDQNSKQMTVLLPESLACYGEGRYEISVQDSCCHECDTVEIWFEADCEILKVSGEEVESSCVDC